MVRAVVARPAAGEKHRPRLCSLTLDRGTGPRTGPSRPGAARRLTGGRRTWCRGGDLNSHLWRPGRPGPVRQKGMACCFRLGMDGCRPTLSGYVVDSPSPRCDQREADVTTRKANRVDHAKVLSEQVRVALPSPRRRDRGQVNSPRARSYSAAIAGERAPETLSRMPPRTYMYSAPKTPAPGPLTMEPM